MQKRVDLLNDEFSFAKFCSKENRAFQCKDNYMCTVSCPLFRARQVQMLVNEKGMTIGEAHRASLHQAIDEKLAKKIIREAVTGEKIEKTGNES